MTSFVDRTVLVTGATGFIGSHLVQRLVAEGARVRALAHYRGHPSLHNLEYLSREELAGIEVIRGDIQDGFAVRRLVEGCDTVFHLAALIAIPYSYRAPAQYVATNVLGTLNLLEACRAEGVRRIVHVSTSECYGTARTTPMDEGHPLQGQSPYSATKIAADKLAEAYHCSFEVPVVTVRPFNTYGPRQSARAIIPTIVTQLLAGEAPLRLGAVEPIRDFTFVTDTVDGMVRAAQVDGIVGELLNLGVGAGISIGDLAHTIMRLVGVDRPIVSEGARARPQKSEVGVLVSDNRKAGQLLGWRPTVPLERGLSETIAFVRAHPGEFRADEYGV